MENIFILKEEVKAPKIKSGFTVNFKYHELNEGFLKTFEAVKNNHIIFLQKGFLRLSCNDFKDRFLKTSECILIPRNSYVKVELIQPSEILVFTFDVLKSMCDKQIIESYKSSYKDIQYNFSVTPIRYPINNFIEQMIYYLRSGLKSEHLFSIKEKEFFLLLKAYYRKDEIITLLYPILGETDFKGFILDNYLQVDSVTDLARLSGMCRTAFDTKFKEVFGMSPRQWMLKQIAQQVKYKAMEPDVKVSDLINVFKFNSATHFNRFCRQQFNCTPGELIKMNRLK